MNEVEKLFEGKHLSSCSTGTIYILDYCMEHDIDCPNWLHCQMYDWDRVIMDDLEDKLEGRSYNSGISNFDMNDHKKSFAEQVMFIMNELEGNWGILVYGDHKGDFVFELEYDAVAFKLRWT